MAKCRECVPHKEQAINRIGDAGQWSIEAKAMVIQWETPLDATFGVMALDAALAKLNHNLSDDRAYRQRPRGGM
jgi:hypothetical protein